MRQEYRKPVENSHIIFQTTIKKALNIAIQRLNI
jgi:hypothetical protein